MTFRWTDDRVATVRRLASHQSASEIAAAIGCGVTRNAVIGLSNRKGISLSKLVCAGLIEVKAATLVEKHEAVIASLGDLKWSDDHVETLKRMWADHATHREIAEKVGRSRTSVITKVRKLGLPKRTFDRSARATRQHASSPTTQHKPMPAVIVDAFTAPPGDFLISIHELRDHGDCRWPYGETAPYLFCGRPATDGSWCEAHGKRAFAGADRPCREGADA